MQLHSGAQYVGILPYEHNLTLNRLYGSQLMCKGNSCEGLVGVANSVSAMH